MTYGPANSIPDNLPEQFDIPKDGEPQRKFLDARERLTASIINIKETAKYELSEILNGQQFFSTNVATGQAKRTRNVFRKVIDFGALPNASTKSIPHGITVTDSTIFTRIYATSTNENTTFIPIPYINTTTPGDSVELSVDPTFVNITTTTANYVAFTITYVILEYIKA